jgi:hypothetical protein
MTPKRLGQRAMGKVIAEAFYHESESSPGKYHETLHYTDDSWSCGCRGWIFNKKCWHIDEDRKASRIADIVPSEQVMSPMGMKKSSIFRMQGSTIVRNMQGDQTPVFIIDRNARRFRLED